MGKKSKLSFIGRDYLRVSWNHRLAEHISIRIFWCEIVRPINELTVFSPQKLVIQGEMQREFNDNMFDLSVVYDEVDSQEQRGRHLW